MRWVVAVVIGGLLVGATDVWADDPGASAVSQPLSVEARDASSDACSRIRRLVGQIQSAASAEAERVGLRELIDYLREQGIVLQLQLATDRATIYQQASHRLVRNRGRADFEAFRRQVLDEAMASLEAQHNARIVTPDGLDEPIELRWTGPGVTVDTAPGESGGAYVCWGMLRLDRVAHLKPLLDAVGSTAVTFDPADAKPFDRSHERSMLADHCSAELEHVLAVERDRARKIQAAEKQSRVMLVYMGLGATAVFIGLPSWWLYRWRIRTEA